MKKKLIKAMLKIAEWVSDDIGNEVDKEDFIDKIKCDLLEVEGVHYQDIEVYCLDEFGYIRVYVDLICSPSLKIYCEFLEGGFKIHSIILVID